MVFVKCDKCGVEEDMVYQDDGLYRWAGGGFMALELTCGLKHLCESCWNEYIEFHKLRIQRLRMTESEIEDEWWKQKSEPKQANES